jgi:antitoxin component of MazEF toxin-antitoxin module
MKNIIEMVTKKLKVYKHITIRGARGGNNPPAIFPAPKEILNEIGLKIGDKCIMGIDGNKIIIIKESEPEIE